MYAHSLVISRGDNNLYRYRCNNRIFENIEMNRVNFRRTMSHDMALACKNFDIICQSIANLQTTITDIPTCNMTCNTDLNVKNVTVYSYSGEGFIYMLIYLAESGSIFHLFTVSPDVVTDANNRNSNGQINEYSFHEYSHF